MTLPVEVISATVFFTARLVRCRKKRIRKKTEAPAAPLH
jgi:hypothetical protein